MKESDGQGNEMTRLSQHQLLDQFVGFDSKSIRRPGIVLHMFHNSTVQKHYNNGVLKRLRERYGYPPATRLASGQQYVLFLSKELDRRLTLLKDLEGQRRLREIILQCG